MSSKNTQREKNSERDTENEAFRLSLLVHGSSVPIYTQQPKALIKKCKSSRTPKVQKRKEFPFPVDKIIYLRERLELLDLTEKKEDSDSESSPGEICSVKDETKAQPPDFDFSLDLSSVLSIESEESFPDERAQTESLVSECAETPTVKSSVSDSVNVYIKTVNKQEELVRYFRPCRTCNELSCVCDENNTRDEISFRRSPCECESCLPVTCSSCCCCHDEFFSPLCGEECGCRRSSSVESDRILPYASTLASAARSARDLARDLEYILTALNNEPEESRRGGF